MTFDVSRYWQGMPSASKENFDGSYETPQSSGNFFAMLYGGFCESSKNIPGKDCPGCGAPVIRYQKHCAYCQRPGDYA